MSFKRRPKKQTQCVSPKHAFTHDRCENTGTVDLPELPHFGFSDGAMLCEKHGELLRRVVAGR